MISFWIDVFMRNPESSWPMLLSIHWISSEVNEVMGSP